MRTIQLDLYTIDELSPSARDKALEHFRYNSHDLYGWHTDNEKSLNAFAKFVGGTPNFSVQMSGYGRSWAKIEGVPNPEEDYGYSTLEWLEDNAYQIEKECAFTGYYMDMVLLDPIREFMDDPDDRTLPELVNEGVEAWVKAYVADWDYAYSDEGLTVYIQANEHEFDKDGNHYG